MAETIVVFIGVLIIVALAWYSGYSAGRADEEARWGARYRDLCARLIEALKRRNDE